MKKFIQISISLSLLVFLFSFDFLDIDTLQSMVKQPFNIFIAMVSIFLILVLTAVRWRLTCRSQNVKPKFQNLLSLVCMSNIAALTLPGGIIAGDAVRATLTFSTDKKKRDVLLSAIIFDRLYSLLILFCLTSCLLTFYIDSIFNNSILKYFLLNIYLLTFVFFIILYLLKNGKFIERLGFLASRLSSFSWIEKIKSRPFGKFGLQTVLRNTSSIFLIFLKDGALIVKNCFIIILGYSLNIVAMTAIFTISNHEILDIIAIASAALSSWCISLVILTPGGLGAGEISFSYFLLEFNAKEMFVKEAIDVFFLHRLIFLAGSFLLWFCNHIVLQFLEFQEKKSI